MAEPSNRQINQAFEAAIVKDRLEQELRRSWNEWSRVVSVEFRSDLEAGLFSGTVSADSQAALSIVLENHYRKTTQAFTNFDLGFIQKQNAVVENTQAQIRNNIEALIVSRVIPQTQEIIGTTEDIMVLAINSARESFAEENETPTNQQIAQTATAIFLARQEGRTIGITTTETTWPSEAARQINNRAVQDPLVNTLQTQQSIALAEGDTTELAAEARELANLSSAESAAEAAIISTGVAAGTMRASRLTTASENVLNMLKTWVTMGDAKVRASHSAANGQTVPDQDAFQVGTSLLQYPADSSLGADIAEIVNCRCFAAYR